MIPAAKSQLFARWFAWSAERRIRSTFASVRIRGLESLAARVAKEPVIVVSNHTSWWDALIVLQVCTRVLRIDAYAMMDANNLRKLPFFARVGAFGVDLSDPRDGARAIRYAAKLLDRQSRLVWIFAQGRETPVTARPLAFRGGSAEIARVARRTVVPAALRYEHGALPEPTVYLAFGDAILPDRDVRAGARAHEAAVEGELGRINQALVSGDEREFEAQYERTPSLFFAVAQRALGFLTRPRTLR